jgi:hypothetical protein
MPDRYPVLKLDKIYKIIKLSCQKYSEAKNEIWDWFSHREHREHRELKNPKS